MHKILVLGGGKIGSAITLMLTRSGAYDVYLVDVNFNHAEHARLKRALPHINAIEIDVTCHDAMSAFLKQNPMQAVISSLPYFHNHAVIALAKEFKLHYFDLTEDAAFIETVQRLAKGAKQAFVPQCGLAPGLVGIIANHLMQHFTTLDIVKLRTGALPADTSNALHYALTWSTDGLINEYANPCIGIENGQLTVFQPLEGLEALEIDGLAYEAFHTSGGLGSLANLYGDKVHVMNYKTIRYPGHCEKIRFLMKDLKLDDDRAMLKRILEKAIPKTHQDVVVLYVSVTGMQKNELVEESYVKKFHPQVIEGESWSAIQVTTAAGVCAVADRVLSTDNQYQGFVFQEQFSWEALLDSRFGHYISS